MKVSNPNTYAAPIDKRHELTVTFILDQVPGAWHDPQDLINWILQNPYVESVEYKGESA